MLWHVHVVDSTTYAPIFGSECLDFDHLTAKKQRHLTFYRYSSQFHQHMSQFPVMRVLPVVLLNHCCFRLSLELEGFEDLVVARCNQLHF